MANAAAQVKSFQVRFDDEKTTRLLDAVVQDYFTNSLVMLTASGFVQYCDDTQPGLFLGQVENDVTVSVLTGDVAGTRFLWVKRTKEGFSMKIAAAVATDVGRAVYARFNNEVTYGPPAGVTLVNYNLVGHVKFVKSSTEVMIVPPPWAKQGIGGGLFVSAASGAQTLSAFHLNKLIECPLAGALTMTLPPIAQTSVGDELTFKLTTAGQQLTLQGSGTDTVEFANSYSGMATAKGSMTYLVSDGSQWLLKGKI